MKRYFPRLIVNLGDANPFDYNGYFVYQTGFDDFEVITWDMEYVESGRTPVSRFGISTDVMEDLSWVNWAGVASSIDEELSELQNQSTDPDPIVRALLYQSAIGYHSVNELDSDPSWLSKWEIVSQHGSAYRGLKDFKRQPLSVTDVFPLGSTVMFDLGAARISLEGKLVSLPYTDWAALVAEQDNHGRIVGTVVRYTQDQLVQVQAHGITVSANPMRLVRASPSKDKYWKRYLFK
jgi:hypothetical protein